MSEMPSDPGLVQTNAPIDGNPQPPTDFPDNPPGPPGGPEMWPSPPPEWPAGDSEPGHEPHTLEDDPNEAYKELIERQAQETPEVPPGY